MKTLRSIPILGFFFRYPLLIVAAVLFVWLILPEGTGPDGLPHFGNVFQYGGSLTYGPALLFMALAFALFGRHLFYRTTVDKDAADGSFTRFWDALTPRERVDRAIVVFSVFFLGACYVFGCVAK